MYKLNRTKEQIKSDFIKQQRFAFREQQRIYNAFKTMTDIGLDEDYIFDEADERRLPSGQIDMVIDGEFKPLSFSIPRFEEKIETLEENLEKTGRKGKDLYVNEENMFPESDLEDIMDLLEDADLNGAFPFDITTDPEPSQVGVRLEDQTFAPATQVSEIKTPPLPKQPTPVVQQTTAPVIPQTGLTASETALLSPDEQAIRLKQRGIA